MKVFSLQMLTCFAYGYNSFTDLYTEIYCS